MFSAQMKLFKEIHIQLHKDGFAFIIIFIVIVGDNCVIFYDNDFLLESCKPLLKNSDLAIMIFYCSSVALRM